MPDPITALGIATGAVQLTQCAINVRDAPAKSKELRDELATLVDLLEGIRHTLETTPSLQLPQSFHTEIHNMHLLIYRLCETSAPGNVEGIRRLKWPFSKEYNLEILDRIGRFKDSVNAEFIRLQIQELHCIAQNVKEIDFKTQKLVDSKEEETMTKLLEWVCPAEINPLQDLNTYKELITENTALWIFDHEMYKTWIESSPSFLWLSGEMGAGKSVLTASVVDRHRSLAQNGKDIECAWFFCDGKQMESPKAKSRFILGSILRQLLETLIRLKKPWLETIKNLQEEALITVDSKISGLFINAIVSISNTVTKVTIVIDGIDECPSRNRSELCDSLLQLANGAINLLVTSRRENDIVKVFSEQAHLEMTQEMLSSDKSIHLDWTFENDRKLKQIKAEERVTLKQQLLSQNTETFRWVCLTLDSLKHCKRPSERSNAMKTLAPGLPATYKRNLDRIDSEDDRIIASRTLTILLYSRRPLRLRYLATAASVDPDCAFTTDQRVDEDGNILDCCGSLIKISKETKFVELSHISVRQFLQTKDLSKNDPNPYFVDEAEGNAVLMRVCFSYLNSPWLLTTISQLRDDQQVLSQLELKFKDKFAFYALYEWPEHAKKVQTNLDIAQYIFNFITGPSFYSWRELWELSNVRDHQWWETNDDGSQETVLWSSRTLCELHSAVIHHRGPPLYYTVDFGFQSVVELLFTDPTFHCDPNEAGGPESYPLLAALENQHLSLAKLLLQKGADVNVKHIFKEHTALHRAIDKADKTTIQLLAQKADPTVCNANGLPPLHWALQKLTDNSESCTEIILMLAQPSFINTKDSHGKTALHFAAQLNNFETVSLLLEKKAEVNISDDRGKTALHAASKNGNVQMVELLLERNADVNIADKVGYTAVHEAVRSGNRQIFATLFDRSGLKRRPIPLFHIKKVDEPVELAQLLVEAYPGDVLYLNVLAEAKLGNGNITEAHKIFDDTVIKDDKNMAVIEWLCGKDGQPQPEDLEKISHRAFCANCHRQMCGIRQKCTWTDCGECECCERCLKLQKRSSICDEHPLILIPSVERIAGEITRREISRNSRR